MKIGDKVFVSKDVNPSWEGEGIVISEPGHNTFYGEDAVGVRMSDGIWEGKVGVFSVNSLTLSTGSIDDLGDLIDSLRSQGYTIEVSVTDPPSKPEPYTL